MDRIPKPIIKEILSFLPRNSQLVARHSSPIFYRCDPFVSPREYLLNMIFTHKDFFMMKMEKGFLNSINVKCIFFKTKNFRTKTLVSLNTVQKARDYIVEIYNILQHRINTLYYYYDDFDNHFIINIYQIEERASGLVEGRIFGTRFHLEVNNNIYGIMYEPCVIGYYMNNLNRHNAKLALVQAIKTMSIGI